MAYYAVLDENNVVIEVFVGDDPESNTEIDMEVWYSNKKGKTVKRTCPNTMMGHYLDPITRNSSPTTQHLAFRKNFAKVGYTYNEELDAFIVPSPYPSWVLDENTGEYVAPVDIPHFNGDWTWDEENVRWKEVPRV